MAAGDKVSEITAQSAAVCEVLEGIARLLVDHPEDMKITSVESVSGVNFVLSVRESDFGKVIGKQGRTARSLRIILSGGAAKAGRRYSLDIRQV